VLTIGIFAVTLWNDLWVALGRPTSVLYVALLYVLLLVMMGLVFIPLGLAQNNAALRFLGFEGSENDIHKKVFETSIPTGVVTDLVLSPRN